MFKERVEKIIDNNVDLDNIDRNDVENILEFDKYKPVDKLSSPCKTDHNYKNPALDYYCSELNWDNGWHPIDKTDVLRCFPEYIPTDKAIDTLKKYEPILEIGAGNGYWAYVLDKADCDILPTDILPHDVSYNNDLPDDFFDKVGTQEYNMLEVDRSGENHETPYVNIGDNKTPSVPWYEVEIADHSVVSEYQNHNIFICHPVAEPWTEDMLDMINKSQKFILVAEWYPGADATPAFYNKLKNWKLLETFPVYDWQSQHAHGYVFEK